MPDRALQWINFLCISCFMAEINAAAGCTLKSPRIASRDWDGNRDWPQSYHRVTDLLPARTKLLIRVLNNHYQTPRVLVNIVAWI
jgi:hypothetical protein